MSQAAAAAGPHHLLPGPQDPPAIRVRGLRKAYGRTTAVDDLQLDIPHGSVFALLGSEGAGKTTVLRILSARTAADGGDVRIAGYDLPTDAGAVRAAVGFAGRASVVDTCRTAEENLRLTPALRRLPAQQGSARAAELLARLGLSGVATEPAAALSSDQRRRLDLAMVLAAGPEVVLMDEPTAGLDPVGRRIVRDVVRDLAADGITVLFTTRSPQEAGQLADRIGVLHRGRLVAEGTQDALLRLVPGGHIRLHFADTADLAAATALFRLDTVVRDEAELSLQIPGDGSMGLIRAVLDILENAQVEPLRLTVHSPGLEDVFTALVNNGSPGPPDAPAGEESRDGRSRWHKVLPIVAAALLLPAYAVEAGLAPLPGVFLTVLVCAALALAGRRRRAAPRPPQRRGPLAQPGPARLDRAGDFSCSR
ncbi:ABC transporter ATP-binding protein [Streptomyces sp. NPDC052396]|uniref:ABC transporter ATP-binding protein n=1 Tax=Streptomyces sp. NPDC052396 TaxID=3365689 RepID=UPI0037CFD1E5